MRVDHASHTIALVLIDKFPSCNINAWKNCPSCSHANNTCSYCGHYFFPGCFLWEAQLASDFLPVVALVGSPVGLVSGADPGLLPLLIEKPVCLQVGLRPCATRW